MLGRKVGYAWQVTQKTRLPFEVWALVAGGFAVAVGYGVVAPAIPQFALEFGVSNFAASAIVSAFALMRLLGAPIAGPMINRFGERSTYMTGILIVAVTTGASAFAMNYPQFVILRGAGGLGSAMFTVSATALLAKVAPVDARGRVASLNTAAFLLGGLLGPVLGGVVAVFGLRAPFIFYFFTLIAATIIVAFALRGSPLATSPKTTGAAAEANELTLSAALRMSQFRTLLISGFAFGWTAFGVRVSLIPLIVAVTFGGDATAAAWILAAYAAGNAIFIFPSGRWNDTVGRKPMLITGMLLLGASYLSVGAAPSLWVLAGIMVVAGVGSALANPGHQAVLADVLDFKRGGNVVAANSMASDLGGVLGPAIAGAVVDLAGFGWAFALTSVLLVIAAIAWMLSPGAKPAKSAEQDQPKQA